jgi:serine/threonine protein kinase
MELKPGGKLGPYEIGSPLGKGGMGEGWLARDPLLGRDVGSKASADQFNESRRGSICGPARFVRKGG